ncbi:hypothetical protein GCM10023336_67240 [Streptomyces similanensis]|uniref:Uncharacterized protein n=1 Tax=Streptomyces similanensis TaxID=1274988 RepID=A0ABP9LEP9_9ACTN
MDVDPYVVHRTRRLCVEAGSGRITAMLGDGGLGAPGHLPARGFDEVVIKHNASDIAPAWHEQLRDGAELVVPLEMGGYTRSLTLVRRGGARRPPAAARRGSRPRLAATGPRRGRPQRVPQQRVAVPGALLRPRRTAESALRQVRVEGEVRRPPAQGAAVRRSQPDFPARDFGVRPNPQRRRDTGAVIMGITVSSLLSPSWPPVLVVGADRRPSGPIRCTVCQRVLRGRPMTARRAAGSLDLRRPVEERDHSRRSS